jgi:sugar phosphate isomerase/epimerase
MQRGIFAKTFPGTSPHVVLRQVKQAGFEIAQYNMACSGLASMPDDIAPAIIADIKAASAETAVLIPALSATYNMIHPSTDERENGQRRLAVVMQAARDMGIATVTLCTGTRDPHDQWAGHPDNSSAAAWGDLRHAMQHAITLAERHDVTLGIEPELANVVNSAQKARQLIDEMQSRHVRIILDPANLFEAEPVPQQNRIISEAIDLLADHIVMVHAKDRKANGTFTAAGTGTLDYPHLVSELKHHNINVPLITHGLTAAEAPGVAAFLREKLAT